MTRGLEMFAGYELAVQFLAAEQSRDAARSLTRLTREALMNGRLVRNREYEGIDGRALHLDWSGPIEAPTMVTILL